MASNWSGRTTVETTAGSASTSKRGLLNVRRSTDSLNSGPTQTVSKPFNPFGVNSKMAAVLCSANAPSGLPFAFGRGGFHLQRVSFTASLEVALNVAMKAVCILCSFWIHSTTDQPVFLIGPLHKPREVRAEPLARA